MRKLVILLLALFAIAGTSAARNHRKPHKVPRRAGVPRAKRYHAPKRGRNRNTSYQSPTRSQKPVARSQQGPSAERYTEIQQALTAKGYYKGEANGAWNADSIDALRRFQSDQNLRVDGKVGSLSLIALGLGPKRTISAQSNPPPAPPDQPEAAPSGVPE